MNVLQIANGYFGNGLYKNLFSALEKLDVKNTVYVPVAYTKSVPEGREDHMIVSPCFSDLDRILFFPKQKHMLQDIERQVALERIEAVHSHTVFSGGYTALQLRKRYGLPYFVAVRNTDVNVFFKRMAHLRSTGINILQGAEKIIFLSPAYREHLFSQYIPASHREALWRKSTVIPNGISDVFFRQPSPKEPPQGTVRFIQVGEVSRNKNVETTIEAVERLRKRGIDAALTVVGAVLDAKYTSMIERRHFVAYFDRCPQTEVITHLRNAHIFIMPSHKETFGLVYAEAMSQGLPVLYTRGQGFDGQFPDGVVGYSISDRNPDDIAEKAAEILARYRVLTQNCIKLAEKFHWDSIAGEYASLYQFCKREQRES